MLYFTEYTKSSPLWLREIKIFRNKTNITMENIDVKLQMDNK